jgi:hypothetical protein
MDELKFEDLKAAGCRFQVTGSRLETGWLKKIGFSQLGCLLSRFVITVESSLGCPVPVMRFTECLRRYVIYELLHNSNNCFFSVTLAFNVGGSHRSFPKHIVCPFLIFS